MKISELIKLLKGIEKIAGDIEIGIRNEIDEFIPLDGYEGAYIDNEKEFCSVSDKDARPCQTL